MPVIHWSMRKEIKEMERKFKWGAYIYDIQPQPMKAEMRKLLFSILSTFESDTPDAQDVLGKHGDKGMEVLPYIVGLVRILNFQAAGIHLSYNLTNAESRNDQNEYNTYCALSYLYAVWAEDHNHEKTLIENFIEQWDK